MDLYLRLKATAIGNIREQILMANEVIRLMDIATDSRVLSDAEFWLRRQLKKKILGLASL